MTNADEITIAEIQAIDPTIPVHAVQKIAELLNAKIAAVALELGWIEETEVES